MSKSDSTESRAEKDEVSTVEEVRNSLESDDPEIVARAIHLLAGDQTDYEYPTSLIRRFKGHPHPGIKCACLMGLTRILLAHDRLDVLLAAELIAAGLKDENDAVYDNAWCVLGDLAGYPGFPPHGYEHLIKYYEEEKRDFNDD